MGKKHILVADDDPDVLEVIKAILEHEGFRVRTARDGEQAYKLVRRKAFDAVILDVAMPKASGLKVLKLMRRSSRLKDVPVMLITGNLLKAKELQENGSANLANECVTKPFNTRDLIQRVRALVNSDSPQPNGRTEENHPRRPSRI
jgi:two-component system phosphate regulon response regulator PhoB